MKTSLPTKFIAAATGLSFCIGAAVAAEPAAGPQKVSVKAVALFDFDKTTINPADREKILAEVGQMTDVAWQTVTTTGHTDSIGSAGYNKKLSKRRAQGVKTYLVGKGLDPKMISTAGKSEDQPVASNDSVEGRRANRRAEIEFQGVRTTAK